MSLKEAAWILGVPVSVTPHDLRQRFRKLSKTAHPDHGGDAETFVVLREAYEKLMDKALRTQTCPDCSGRGFVIFGKFGFTEIKRSCKRCNGSGVILDKILNPEDF